MENAHIKRKRLIKNTLMLYTRTFITMIISLYSVRIILNALGAEDYGIQNVVSGFISMFSFVTGSLSVAISRFMSIEIEKKDNCQLIKVYSASIQIMLLISAALIIIIETFGVWFLNNEMNIPVNRLNAANWVLQFSALTLLFSLISVPFDALIISHERMGAFAYISIFSSILKLAIAFLISYAPFDRLTYYALLLLLQAVIIRICYGIYCSRNFKQIKFKKKFETPLIKKILSLSGWDLWGSSSFILKNYGVNIILNIFYGATVNAARGIAMQVNAAVTQFSGGFLTALRPQITKTHASGDKKLLWQMVDSGTKFATYLLLLISIPIILECNYILQIWLGEIPEYTVNFVILTIILSLSEGTLIYTQNTALMANGKIKAVQLITGTIQLCNIPIAYILLKSGLSPESTIILAIVIAQICCFIRSSILTKLTGYSTSNFLKNVYLKIAAVGIASALPLIYFRDLFEAGFDRLIIVTATSITWSCIVIYSIGCNRQERSFINQKLNILYSKLLHR